MTVMRKRLAWWLFDRSPEWFQAWVESWARTVIIHRYRRKAYPIVWNTATSSTIPGVKFTYTPTSPMREANE